ncbi:FliH/SctL family protein [Desulfovulcanus sp.]
MSKTASRTGGRLIVGLQTKLVSEVQTKQANQPFLSPEIEVQFWERVKVRAEQKAREIIARAMEEAKTIKSQARQEGFAEGRAEAISEIESVKQEFGEQFSKLMTSIQEEKSKIWQECQEDIILLTKAAVEKVLGVTLAENKEQILTNLFHQALEQIEEKKELLIKVNPNDAELMREVLEKAKTSYPQLGQCQVKSDPAIEQGGVILENKNSIVNNTIDARYAEVKKILDQLELGG